VAEWFKAHAWKACWGQLLAGSNPVFSAIPSLKFLYQKNKDLIYTQKSQSCLRVCFMQFDIRPATRNDVSALFEIERIVFDPEKFHLITKRQYRYLIDKGNADIFLGVVDGKPWASSILLYKKNADYGRLYSIAVHPHMQGRGLGAALLHHAEQRVKGKNLSELRQEVRCDDHALINRYKKTGYVVYGETVEYYPDGAACVKLGKSFK
jgi:ribosomal-protein-alanine N-acetyltransferase